MNFKKLYNENIRPKKMMCYFEDNETMLWAMNASFEIVKIEHDEYGNHIVYLGRKKEKNHV